MRIVKRNSESGPEMEKGILIPYVHRDGWVFQVLREKDVGIRIASVLLTNAEAKEAYEEGAD